MSRSRILIAVRSLQTAEKMAAMVSDLADRLEARVLVVHVAHLHEDDNTETDARQRGDQTLRFVADRLESAGVEVEAMMLFSDDIAKAILKTAAAHDCTVIILGLTGKGVLKRLIEGNVPGNILKSSPIPVMVCPEIWEGLL